MLSARRIWDRRWVISKRRAPFEHPVDGLLDAVLGRAVDGAGRVVENQDARVGEQGAGDGQALALAAGEGHAALADHRVVAILEAHDEVVGLGVWPPARWLRRSALLAEAKGDVLLDRCARRGRRPVRWSTPGSASVAMFQSRTSTPSMVMRPLVDIIDAVDQLGQRALARPGLADDGNGLARRGREQIFLSTEASP